MEPSTGGNVGGVVTSTKVYGTTGIPYFGKNAISGDNSGKIAQLDTLFNDFMLAVRNLTAPGNDAALLKFGGGLEGIYWPAFTCVTGKPIVANV